MLHFMTHAYKLSAVLQFLAAIFDDISQDGQNKEMLTLILLSYIFHIERKQHMRERPIGVTILAILAAVAAVLAAIHALQFLGIIPFFIGPYCSSPLFQLLVCSDVGYWSGYTSGWCRRSGGLNHKPGCSW